MASVSSNFPLLCCSYLVATPIPVAYICIGYHFGPAQTLHKMYYHTSFEVVGKSQFSVVCFCSIGCAIHVNDFHVFHGLNMIQTPLDSLCCYSSSFST